MRAVFELIRDAVLSYFRHRAPQLAAAVAFYTLFSLAPVLLIALAVAGMFLDQAEVRTALIDGIEAEVGEATAMEIDAIIDRVQIRQGSSVGSIVALGVMLLGATVVFKQLKEAMNQVWEYHHPHNFLWRWTKTRLFGLGMVAIIATMLMLSLFANIALTQVNALIAEHVLAPEAVLNAANAAGFYVVVTTAFAVMYKYLPDRKVWWREAWTGAVVGAALFALGKWLAGSYMRGGAVASAYGAAGAIIVLLLWVYYSALIFFFGAEVAHTFAKKWGSLLAAGQERFEAETEP